jgi:hypothetical protein
MSTVLVRYQTKPDKADENQQLVESVFRELNASDPGGLRYMTLRFGENHFAHIAQIDGESNPLRETAAFAEFQREIDDRCVEGPNPVDATIVGSYGFGGAGGT